MLLTLARACEEIAAYDLKKLTDDRVILRRETGLDFITRPDTGRIVLDEDDAAVLILYAELRRAGHKVLLAGTIASRIRTAMRAYPDADQLVMARLENGSAFTLPAEMLNLSSGYTSGQFLLTAMLVDCRNLRARVRRAIKAYEPESEVENVAA
jgi:hypothetical protein